MIKFFRKIRQKLLTENKFSKYLLYAIGEILLIVIGLFIAIQLNNINLDKAVYNKQLQHLKYIKAEMTNNLTVMNEKLELSHEILKAERKIVNHKSNSLTELEFSELLRTITFNELIVPFENGVLNEIISSGGLKDIRNDSIRNILASWEGKKTDLISQELQLAEVRNTIINFYSYEGSIRTILDIDTYLKNLDINRSNDLYSNLKLLESRTFENAIFHHMLLTWYLGYSIYPKLESDINELIRLIDIELGIHKK
jgi:hypothetical protein